MQQEKLKENDDETRVLLSVDGEDNVIECDGESSKKSAKTLAITAPITSPVSRKMRTSVLTGSTLQKEKEKGDSGRKSGAEDDGPEKPNASNGDNAPDDIPSSTSKKDS